jgi:hypothetical protein
MNADMTAYRHTQWGPWSILLYAFFIVCCIVGVLSRHEPVVLIIMPAVGLVMIVLAPCFHYLTVADEGDHLQIRFGPLPLFQKRILYEDIRHIEIGRTTILDSWGIHGSLRGGMVWNIWGRDCVTVHHRGITHIGTDDAETLAALLKTKMSHRWNTD